MRFPLARVLFDLAERVDLDDLGARIGAGQRDPIDCLSDILGVERLIGPRVIIGRRVIVQLWDWEDGGPVYELQHIILTQTSDGYRTQSHSCRCRALTREDVEACFVEAGASEVEWLETEATGFYQPVMWVTWLPFHP